MFWVVSILFFLIAFGAMTTEQIQLGGGGNVNKNAPVAIAQVSQILTLFYMFVTTAFVANVIVRDHESGFGPMVRSTRVTRFDYLIGRFLGAFIAASITFLVVPFAIWLGSMMPWVDPETMGANRFGAYLYAYFLLALPNLFLTSAVFFAVATMTRSMVYSYLGVIVFIVLNVVVLSVLRAKPELRELGAFIEPFGIGAMARATRYFTASDSNTQLPLFAGALLWNRVIWLAVGVAALVLAYARFSFSERAASTRQLRRQQRRNAKLAASKAVIVERLPSARPQASAWARLSLRCRFEMALVFRSPAFIILLLIGLFNALAGLMFAGELYGTPTRPLTFAAIGTLMGAFGIIPIIIAIYYGGEVVWRDRERRMHEIIDATSLPNWAYIVPKVLAVAGVLFATLLVSAGGAVMVQLVRGVSALEPLQYLGWYLLPMTVDMVLFAVLSVFVQALSPNKFVGWGVMVIYIVASITFESIGLEHPLYSYGSAGTVLLSDMNGDQIGGALGWWLRLYWSGIALALAVIAHLLWRRGAETRLLPRLRRVPAGMRGVAGGLLVGGLTISAVTGAWLFWQMNVLNTYRTRDDREARMADYEKKYLKFASVLQPSLTDIKIDVALHPSRRQMEARGSYRFVNDTGAPLQELHVRLLNDFTDIAKIEVPGGMLAFNDADMKYRIYRFARPIAPGGSGSLSFTTRRQTVGLRANGDDTQLVANGTFLNNGDFMPLVGMNRDGLLTDRAKRRKYGLSPELRKAKLEDPLAQRRNYIGNASWVNADITVSTDAGQTPIAPGRKLSDTVANGRRTAHFVSPRPILAFFSVQSAAYAEKRSTAGDVNLSVFYHPGHAYNVDRMLAAMRTALGYYRTNFGPYQFDYARIVEFPGYETFAQAFAGTIPYSERLGFLADNNSADKIDYVTYVTAHELAHQYWGHQIVGADMQGGTVLVETMAQYSALMVMKRLYGEDKIRRFLKYELDSYLRARGSERVEELPLDRVENQDYIHYRKGSVVMYLLQDRLGEDRVNGVLRALLAKYRFKGAPYPRSLDLVQGLLGIARTPADRDLILDLFDRITIYDFKAKTATVRQLPDGLFETVLTIEANKFYANGIGKETAAPLADMIDVGLFDQKPELGAFSNKDVVLIERRPIRTGEQSVRIVTRRKPTFAGIDPYTKYVDRNSDDNLVAVTGG